MHVWSGKSTTCTCLLKRIYGSTSEKFDPRQGVLFDAPGRRGRDGRQPAATAARRAAGSQNRDKHGRGRIPDKIQREEVIHDLSEAEMAALGGAENLVELPPERSEQLDWRPSTLFVVVHVRKKYARKVPLPESGLTLAEQNVAVARKPPEAIPGGFGRAGADGPGDRQQRCRPSALAPAGRDLPAAGRSHLRGRRWTAGGSRRPSSSSPCTPWRSAWCSASHVIHTDDTSVKVRDAWQKRKYTGRFWPYVGDPLHPLTVFDFTTTHQRDGPAAFLKDYRGYLQADAFNGYDGIYLESQGRIVEVGCWAHARRKFHESRRLDAAADGDGVGLDRQTLRGGEGPARTLPGRVEASSHWRSAPRGSPPSGRSDLGRSWTASIPGWKRKRPRSCPRARFVGRWTTRSRTGRPCPCTLTTAGWTSTTTRARTRFAASALDAATGFSWERPWRPRGGDPFQPAGLLQASRP